MSPKILVVTSFSESGYELYGKSFLESWQKNWPSECKLAVYHHSNFRSEAWNPSFESNDRVTYYNLDLVAELNPFKENVAQLLEKKVGNSYPDVPWQLDAIKFTNKVFALANANVNLGKDFDWIVWLDADTITHRPVSFNRLSYWLNPEADIVHLGRHVTTYSETSFVGYKVNGGRGKAAWLIDDLIWTFLSGEFQHYTEWHDGFIFERLMKLSQNHGLVCSNLSKDVHVLEAFSNSELGFFMEHKKGNRKFAQQQQQGEPSAPMVGPNRVPFKVNPKDCVPQKEIRDNILTNIGFIKKWLAPCKDTNLQAIFASGGPSLKKYLPEIKRRQDEEGAVVFCVKHSYPVLLEAGIRPDFCVIIDPRTIEGVSTHGANRKELFKNLHPDTVFLVSSMAHMSVAPFFVERGAKVLGWHAATGELMQILPKVKCEEKYRQAVTIGTCSAIRGIGIARLMGFTNICLAGYDSSLGGKPNNPEELLDTGMKKYYKVGLNPTSGVQVYHVIDENQEPQKDESFYWTTGELIALYQDFLGVIPVLETPQAGFNIEVLNDDSTLIGKGWNIHKAISKVKEEQKQLFTATAPGWAELMAGPDVNLKMV